MLVSSNVTDSGPDVVSGVVTVLHLFLKTVNDPHVPTTFWDILDRLTGVENAPAH